MSDIENGETRHIVDIEAFEEAEQRASDELEEQLNPYSNETSSFLEFADEEEINELQFDEKDLVWTSQRASIRDLGSRIANKTTLTLLGVFGAPISKADVKTFDEDGVMWNIFSDRETLSITRISEDGNGVELVEDLFLKRNSDSPDYLDWGNGAIYAEEIDEDADTTDQRIYFDTKQGARSGLRVPGFLRLISGARRVVEDQQ
jgi:hypothetical protein